MSSLFDSRVLHEMIVFVVKVDILSILHGKIEGVLGTKLCF
jgi:hypothetical protein